MPSAEHPLPSYYQDNITINDIAFTFGSGHSLSSTKYLGSLHNMSTSPTSSPPPAPAVAEGGTTCPKPPNPHIYRPVSPSLASRDKHGPIAKFTLNTVAVLRVMAIGFSIGEVVTSFDQYTMNKGLTHYFRFLAFMQLFWLVFALLTQGSGRPRRSRGEKRRRGPVTLDLGFVQCIFGRGYDEAEERLLAWIPGSAGEQKSWKGRVFFTAGDLLFMMLTFIVAGVTCDNYRAWMWSRVPAFEGMTFTVASLEFLIVVAQQFQILKRAKIHVSLDDDEEDDESGSHKYRIQLPQSPESPERQAMMSVAA